MSRVCEFGLAKQSIHAEKLSQRSVVEGLTGQGICEISAADPPSTQTSTRTPPRKNLREFEFRRLVNQSDNENVRVWGSEGARTRTRS